MTDEKKDEYTCVLAVWNLQKKMAEEEVADEPADDADLTAMLREVMKCCERSE